jgi:D-tyrosyl-tRNA(Tyr) deacylase
MRLVLQRVSSASVAVDGAPHAAIGPGLVVLVGLLAGDTDEHMTWCVDKLVDMRIFEDDAGKMNTSVKDLAGTHPGAGLLLIPNFTLAADATQGRRPSFDAAMKPDRAGPMFERYVQMVRDRAPGLTIASGVFRSHMQVALTNDGPVTILLDSYRPAQSSASPAQFTREQWQSIGVAMGFMQSMS